MGQALTSSAPTSSIVDTQPAKLHVGTIKFDTIVSRKVSL